MADSQQTTQDQTGIQRDATGAIADQKPESKPTTSQTTAETKTEPNQAAKPPAKAEDKTLADAAGDKTLADTKGPPAVYEFKAPEGYELDKAVIDKITPVFKELGLDNAGAQRLVDFYSEQAMAAAEAPVKFYQEMREGWRKSVISDKALGNGTDGLKTEVKASIGAVIDSLGSGAATFREAMNLSGVGDHPAFIKALYDISKRLGEGKHVQGNSPSKFGSGNPNRPQGPGAAALYPNLPSGNT